jgi:flagellar basal-body rod modification protein FlgD
MNDFSWDGITDHGERAAPGVYGVRAVGNVGGQAQALSTLIAARVDSVDLNGASGLTLNLAGLGPVTFSQVRQILPSGI